MKTLLSNWTFIRSFHLLASLVVIYAAYDYGNNVFLYILGIGFLAQSLMNVGCSAGQCNRPTNFKYRRRH